MCHARGDPHYLTFDGVDYNFMAPGVYQLVHSTTECGCDLEVQAFMMSILPHPVASFNVAVAMKVGEALFVIKSNLEMMVVAPDGVPTTLLPVDVPAAGVKVGSSLVSKVSTLYKGKTVDGYKISIPGGGYLLAYAWLSPWDGLPNGHLLSVWISLPHAAAAAAQGLCAQKCTGTPPLPNYGCGDFPGPACLPVYTDQSIFPTPVLYELEVTAAFTLGSSTRSVMGDCAGQPADTYCVNGTCAAVPVCEAGSDKAVSDEPLVDKASLPFSNLTALSFHTGHQGYPNHCGEIGESGKLHMNVCGGLLIDDGVFFESFPPPARLQMKRAKGDPGLCFSYHGYAATWIECEDPPDNWGQLWYFEKEDGTMPNATHPGIPLKWPGARLRTASPGSEEKCLDLHVDDGYMYLGPCEPARPKKLFYLDGSKMTVPGDPCSLGCTSPSVAGSWYEGHELSVWSAADTSEQSDCGTWCSTQLNESCAVKAALMLPEAQARCGFMATSLGSSLGTCGIFVGHGMEVVAGKAMTFFATPTACEVDKMAIKPCEPTPATACEVEGIDIAVARALCANHTAGAECIYDYCASGGDADMVECSGFNDYIETTLTDGNGDDLSNLPPEPSPSLIPNDVMTESGTDVMNCSTIEELFTTDIVSFCSTLVTGYACPGDPIGTIGYMPEDTIGFHCCCFTLHPPAAPPLGGPPTMSLPPSLSPQILPSPLPAASCQCQMVVTLDGSCADLAQALGNDFGNSIASSVKTLGMDIELRTPVSAFGPPVPMVDSLITELSCGSSSAGKDAATLRRSKHQGKKKIQREMEREERAGVNRTEANQTETEEKMAEEEKEEETEEETEHETEQEGGILLLGDESKGTTAMTITIEVPDGSGLGDITRYAAALAQMNATGLSAAIGTTVAHVSTVTTSAACYDVSPSPSPWPSASLLLPPSSPVESAISASPPPALVPEPAAEKTAEVYDDPHIKSLSGNTFFMHGVGVFDYASAGDVRSQVYMCPYADCSFDKLTSGECLTFISAVAIQTPAHTVLLRSDTLLVDGAQQTSQQNVDIGAFKISGVGSQSGTSVARVSHDELANCYSDGQKAAPRGWFWENCTSAGWKIGTPEFELDIGVVGPFEEGWLMEDVSDRTFNIEVTNVNHVQTIGGIINGDVNGEFKLAPDKRLLPNTDQVAHPGDTEVRADNVPPSEVIFPDVMMQQLNSRCLFGADDGGAMQLTALPPGATIPIRELRRVRRQPAGARWP